MASSTSASSLGNGTEKSAPVGANGPPGIASLAYASSLSLSQLSQAGDAAGAVAPASPPSGFPLQGSMGGLLSQSGSSTALRLGQTITACEACRNGHLRCDGGMPCQQCQMRARKCAYSQPKKRGPKTGNKTEGVKQDPEHAARKKAKASNKEAERLGHDMDLMKKEVEDWKHKYLMLVTSKTPAPTTSQMWGVDLTLYSNALLTEYCNCYYGLIYPLFPNVSVPDIKSFPAATPQQLYLTYAILANGARIHGNVVHSEEFGMRAREIAKDLFDTTNFEVAKAHGLMWFYYFMGGDSLRAVYYVSLALRVCENLSAERTLLAKHAVIVTLLFCRDAQERDRLCQSLLKLDMQTRENITFLIAQALAELRYGKENPDYLSTLKKLDNADQILAGTAMEPALATANRCLIYGLRSAILWRAGMKELAMDWAMKTSQLFQAIDVSRSACPTCMIGLDLSAQVHYESDQRNMFNDDLRCLRGLATPYPLAQKMIRRLTSPALMKRFDSALDFTDEGNPVMGSPQVSTQQMPVDPLLGFAAVYGIPEPQPQSSASAVPHEQLAPFDKSHGIF